jgi:hypothetical protein
LARALVMSGAVDAGIAELLATHDTTVPGGGPDRLWLAGITTLATSVQLGDTDLGASVVDEVTAMGGADLLGGSDRAVGLALHHLQAGDPETAAEVLATVTDERGYVDAGRALVAVGRGDVDEALRWADSVATHHHTYLDRAYADIARALALVRRDAADEARRVLSGAIAALDDTDDRLAQAVLRLVDAVVAEAAHHPDAAAVRSVAEQRLGAIDIRAEGWRALLAGALGAVTA